jgi:hypothetical protein
MKIFCISSHVTTILIFREEELTKGKPLTCKRETLVKTYWLFFSQSISGKGQVIT